MKASHLQSLCLLFILSFSVFATTSTPTLIARVSNVDSYRLPVGSSLNDVTPSIDNKGNRIDKKHLLFNVFYVSNEIDNLY